MSSNELGQLDNPPGVLTISSTPSDDGKKPKRKRMEEAASGDSSQTEKLIETIENLSNKIDKMQETINKMTDQLAKKDEECRNLYRIINGKNENINQPKEIVSNDQHMDVEQNDQHSGDTNAATSQQNISEINAPTPPIGNHNHTFQRENTTRTETSNAKTNVKYETARNRDIPPIVIERDVDKVETFAKIKQITPNVNLQKINESKYRVCVLDNIENHKKVLELIKQLGKQGCSYQQKGSKPINVLIRNLELRADLTEAEIQKAYEEKNFAITKITKWHTPTMKRNEKFFWLASFDCKTDTAKLYATKQICGVSVRYEKPVNKLEIIQCKKCRRFEHSAAGCFYEFRCIKCAENHLPNECRLPDTSKPYCVNCRKIDHPANSPRCPKYIEILNRRKKYVERTEQTPNEKVSNQKQGEWTTVGKKNKPIFTKRTGPPNLTLMAQANNPKKNVNPKKKNKKKVQQKNTAPMESRLSKIESAIEQLTKIARSFAGTSSKYS